MIISFTIRNFKSIREETTLFFKADEQDKIYQENLAHPDSRTPVLRTLGLWGPNASGKSNILEALKQLQILLSTSHRNNLEDSIQAYHPCRLDSSYRNAPIYFELDFVTSQKNRFVYSVEFTSSVIHYECLELYTSAKTTALFTRKQFQGESYIKFSQRLNGKKDLSCLDNQSFLGLAANTPDTSFYLKEAYLYIQTQIIFVAPNNGIYSPKLLTDTVYTQALTTLLSCADTGITQIHSREHEIDPQTLPDSMPPNLKEELCRDFKWDPIFYHHQSQEKFHLLDESAGTRRLYQLAPLLLLGMSQGTENVFICDEIDCQLHPQLVKMIIFLFHDSKINSGNPQLLFTTHNSSLMNSDYFRRDQIGLVQKDQTGASSLSFLSEYEQVRYNTNFEKWYREGRFESLPEIKYALLQKTIQQLQLKQEKETEQ